MSLHLITSVSGAPGVSTAALGMTLLWPGPSMLVDSDVQQHTLAGYFGGSEAPEPNLANLAIAAARTETDLGEVFWQVARRFPNDAEPNRRLFVPGPMNPWARTTIERQWGFLAPALARLGTTTDLDVIVDLGRLVAPSTPTPVLVPVQLLDSSASVTVVIEPTLQGIAAARIVLEGLSVQVKQSVHQPLLSLLLRQPVRTPKRIGQESAQMRTYSARETSHELGLPVLGDLVHDAAGAIRLNQGQPWEKTPLAKNLTSLARDLKHQADVRAAADDVLGDLR